MSKKGCARYFSVPDEHSEGVIKKQLDSHTGSRKHML